MSTENEPTTAELSERINRLAEGVATLNERTFEDSITIRVLTMAVSLLMGGDAAYNAFNSLTDDLKDITAKISSGAVTDSRVTELVDNAIDNFCQRVVRR